MSDIVSVITKHTESRKCGVEMRFDFSGLSPLEILEELVELNTILLDAVENNVQVIELAGMKLPPEAMQ